MGVELSAEAEWKLRYAGEIARLQNRFPEQDEVDGAYSQFGSDHDPEECAWEETADGAREA